MTIAGILFDKDGTLLDYAASWPPINRRAAALAADGDVELAERLLRSGGADPASGRVEPDSVLAAGTTAEIAAAWVEAGARFSAAALTAALDRLFSAAAAEVVPVTDLASLFGRLRARGVRLGVASSDNETSIRLTAERFGIASLVDFMAGYDSGFGSKPGAGMIEGFCRSTALAARHVAVVGDNAQDLLMGRAAGAGRVIGVLTGTGTYATLAPLADLCLASIAGIEAALFPQPSATFRPME
ncbi:MAG TPA: HAD family hydrolase [Alphaproteobacteria bacterium]|nr:HAD family hydrolase [Alphaproteobacteria bacterium]